MTLNGTCCYSYEGTAVDILNGIFKLLSNISNNLKMLLRSRKIKMEE